MTEPITNPAPMFFELEHIERTSGLKKFSREWADILTQCEKDGITLEAWAQSEYPVPTMDGEPRSALASWMELSGIVTNDNKQTGVKSTPMNQIDTPWKKAIFIEGLSASVRNNLQGYKEDPVIQTLAGPASSADYAQGTSVHPRMYLPLRDASRLTAYPPLSAVASQVTVQNGQIAIPEFKENKLGAGPHPWTDGDEIILDTARIRENNTTPKALAGGFKITDGLWMSSVGASFVQLQANRYRVRVERKLVKEIITKEKVAGNAKRKGVGLTGDVYDPGVITNIVMLYNEEQQDFMVTTLLGNRATVKKYLNIDRSKHFTYSGMRNLIGQVNGTDRYGKMPSDRLVYDLPSTQMPTGDAIADNELLAIDANETASVYIMEDTSRETVKDLERSTAFSYTLKYVTTLNQEDGEPVRLLDNDS